MEGMLGRILERLKRSFGGPHSPDSLYAEPDTTKSIDSLIQDSLRTAIPKTPISDDPIKNLGQGPLMKLIMMKLDENKGIY